MVRAPRPALLFLAFLAPAAARADSFRTPPLKPRAPVSIQGYGGQNPACAEWSDGCTVCAVRDGRARCSTPGIACTPGGVTCLRRAAP